MSQRVSGASLAGFLDDYRKIDRHEWHQAHRIGLDLQACRDALAEIVDMLAVLPEGVAYDAYVLALRTLQLKVSDDE